MILTLISKGYPLMCDKKLEWTVHVVYPHTYFRWKSCLRSPWSMRKWCARSKRSLRVIAQSRCGFVPEEHCALSPARIRIRDPVEACHIMQDQIAPVRAALCTWLPRLQTGWHTYPEWGNLAGVTVVNRVIAWRTCVKTTANLSHEISGHGLHWKDL